MHINEVGVFMEQKNPAIKYYLNGFIPVYQQIFPKMDDAKGYIECTFPSFTMQSVSYHHSVGNVASPVDFGFVFYHSNGMLAVVSNRNGKVVDDLYYVVDGYQNHAFSDGVIINQDGNVLICEKDVSFERLAEILSGSNLISPWPKSNPYMYQQSFFKEDGNSMINLIDYMTLAAGDYELIDGDERLGLILYPCECLEGFMSTSQSEVLSLSKEKEYTKRD